MHRESNPAKGQDVRRARGEPESDRAVVGGRAGKRQDGCRARGRAGKRAGRLSGKGARRQNDGLLPDFRREVLLVALLTGRTAPGFTTCAQLFTKMATACHYLENLNESGSEIGEAEWL